MDRKTSDDPINSLCDAGENIQAARASLLKAGDTEIAARLLEAYAVLSGIACDLGEEAARNTSGTEHGCYGCGNTASAYRLAVPDWERYCSRCW